MAATKTSATSAPTIPGLYSPVTAESDGSVQVHLGEDHPGFRDEAYRERRNEIAAVAVSWQPGQPVPHIDYTDEENRVWAMVARELAPKHEQYAHSEFLSAKENLTLPTHRVPQLDEVTALIRPLTDWTYVAAPGLVESASPLAAALHPRTRHHP